MKSRQWPRSPLVMVLAVVSLAHSAADHRGRYSRRSRRGDLSAVRETIAADPAAIAARDEDGRTPLHWACRGDHLELVAYLLDRGADVNAVDDYGNTPLHNLAHRNLAPAIGLLLRRDPKLNIQNHELNTALHYAAAADATDAVEVLATAGADLELRDDRGRTALILCARERGGLATARALVAAGAKVDARDVYGATALDLAAWRGKREVVDLLLDSGARLPSGGDASRSLLNEAAAHGLSRLFAAIVEAGTKPDDTLQDGGALLHRAAGGGSIRNPRAPARRWPGRQPRRSLRLDGAPLRGLQRPSRQRPAPRLEGGRAGRPQPDGSDPVQRCRRDGLGSGRRDATRPGRHVRAAPVPAARRPVPRPAPPGDEPQPFAVGIVSSVWGLHSAVSFAPNGDLALWAPMVERPDQIYSQGGVLMSERDSWALDAAAVGALHWSGRRRRAVLRSGWTTGLLHRQSRTGGWIRLGAREDLVQRPCRRRLVRPTTGRRRGQQFPPALAVCRRQGSRHLLQRRPARLASAAAISTCRPGRKEAGASRSTSAPRSTLPPTSPLPSSPLTGATCSFSATVTSTSVIGRPMAAGPSQENWRAPINTPDRELCPIVSPDGKYLFFLSTRDGGRHVWWVSTEGLALASPAVTERAEKRP